MDYEETEMVALFSSLSEQGSQEEQESIWADIVAQTVRLVYQAALDPHEDTDECPVDTPSCRS